MRNERGGAMSTNSITLCFYRFSSEYDDSEFANKIDAILEPYIQGEKAPADKIDNGKVQMQYLKKFDNGNIVCGIMRKFRDDSPIFGKIDEAKERFPNMDSDEYWVEKIHFLYDRRWQILLCQNNNTGVSHNVFSDYMSRIADFPMILASVFTKRAYEIFLNESELELEKVEFKMARPTCVAMIKKAKNQFSEGVMSVLDASGGKFVKMELSGNMRKAGDDEKLLDKEFVPFVRILRDSLTDSQDRGKVKFRDSKSGLPQVVDLINDKFKATLRPNEVQSVIENQGNKKYVNSDKLYDIMRQKMKDSELELEEIFGPSNVS